MLIQFILNQDEIKTDLPPGHTMLDFIRYRKQLTGTKIGCREGDCGACTILIGEYKSGRVVYSSATSCLMPIAHAQGRHIVTVEGINMEALNAVQEAFACEGATQCGFCTPGFVVSLTGFCISEVKPSYAGAIDSMNGNICRCTGYKSIERAAMVINEKMRLRNGTDPIRFAVDNNILPGYFLGINEKLKQWNVAASAETAGNDFIKFMGGGTDLYVQQHDTIADEAIEFLASRASLKGISQDGNICEMGAAVTVSDMASSEIFKSHFNGLQEYIRLVSSTPIRNMATVAGNFINASPIGDLTIFFLAMNASVQLSDGNAARRIPLNRLYQGYKKLDKAPGEFIEKIFFDLPGKNDLFNFEKVSKRTNLDIASVNTAIHLKMDGNRIISASLSAGGVGPVPAYLFKSSGFLAGRELSVELLEELLVWVESEISPISDARGSETYKRLLLKQLIKAHFIKLFPSLPVTRLIKCSQ